MRRRPALPAHRGPTRLRNARLLPRRHPRARPHPRLAQTLGRQALPVQIQPAPALHRTHLRVRLDERDLARFQPAHPARHPRIRRLLRRARHRAGPVGLHVRTPLHGPAHAIPARPRRVPRNRRRAVRVHRPHAPPHIEHRRRPRLRPVMPAYRRLPAAVPLRQIQHLRRRDLRPRQGPIQAGR